jgi:hypothetical protein
MFSIYRITNRRARRAVLSVTTPIIIAAVTTINVIQGLADLACAAGIGALYVWRDCRDDWREIARDTRRAWDA